MIRPHIARPLAVAILLAVCTPQAAVAQTAPIRPTISTTMQRACDSEFTVLIRMDNGREVAAPQPTVQRMTRILRVKRAGAGYQFEHTTTDPASSSVLRFDLSDRGVVSGAELSGPAFAAAGPMDLPALASAWADDLPERLLVGRMIAVGDSYYPEPLRSTLLGRTMQSMGLPFDVTGTLDFKYQGEVAHEGRRAWRFGGQSTAQGTGTIEGIPLAVVVTSDSEVLHDVETGLVLSYRSRNTTKVEANGRLFRILENGETYTCRILPV